MNAAVFQAGAVIPLILLLAVLTATHPSKRTPHRLLLLVLLVNSGWCAASGAAFSEFDTDVRRVGFQVANVLSTVLTPLCLITIGSYARLEVFERDLRVSAVIFTPFVFFAAAILTNDHHSLFYRSWQDLAEARSPREWAGPLFWAFNLWVFPTIFASISICVRGLRRALDSDERGRWALVLLAVLLPVVAHAAWIGAWLPIDYPLTPASLGATGLALFAAVHRFDLLDRHPVVSRDVLDHLRDGLLLADADGTVIDANPPALEMLGCEADEVVGQDFETVLRRLGVGADGDGLLGEALGHAPQTLVEVTSADDRVLEVEISPLVTGPHDEESGSGRFALIRDRSVERRNERLSRQRQKLESVGRLAAGVAHEVNNPLAYVRANLFHVRQLADELEKAAGQAPATSWDEMREVVEESVSGIDRIGRIVERLLRFSHPSEGRCRVDLHPLVVEALRFASLQRGHEVRLETRLAPESPAVTAAPDRLIQALLNLLLNARQALSGREDPRIRVATRVGDGEAGFVEVEVSDNGPGIPPELRDRIFDPFFTTRPPGEGTGLGLAIAFDIAREHEGHLEVGTSEWGGARFRLRLPLDSGGPAESGPPEAVGAEDGG